jgi:hypothetical protein
MRKTTTKFLIPAVSFLCLLALGACAPGADEKSPGEKTREVIITNIPTEMKAGGPVPYKIYVQLSESMSKDDPHTAITSGKIEECRNQDGNVTLRLFEDEAMTIPWEGGSGSYYIAVTISPQSVSSWQDIQVKVPGINRRPFSSETNVIDWASSINLNSLGSLGKPRIEAIYDLIIQKDPDITKTQE